MPELLALPRAGVTTHPEPATCCEKYPCCDCIHESLGWILGFYEKDGTLTRDGVARKLPGYGMNFGSVLYMLKQGCFIYRKSESERWYRIVDGKIVWFYRHIPRPGRSYNWPLFPGLTSVIDSAGLLADDWHYRCPGHSWLYHPDDDLRQCRYCEHEEYGDFKKEAA